MIAPHSAPRGVRFEASKSSSSTGKPETPYSNPSMCLPCVVPVVALRRAGRYAKFPRWRDSNHEAASIGDACPQGDLLRVLGVLRPVMKVRKAMEGITMRGVVRAAQRFARPPKALHGAGGVTRMERKDVVFQGT